MVASNGAGGVVALIRDFLADDLLHDSMPPTLDEGTLLLSGLLDSAGLFQLVVFLEEEFDIEIDDSEITPPYFETLGDIARMVEEKVAARAQSAGDAREE